MPSDQPSSAEDTYTPWPVAQSSEQVIELVKANAELKNQLNRRHRIEQVLLETKRRLQGLLASSPAVIYSSEPTEDYGITFISESISHFGYEPQQFLENSWFWQRQIHPDDRLHVFTELAHLKLQEHRVFEYRFLNQQGEYRWIQDRRQLIRDELGRVIEIIGSWQDITDRKRAEQALFQEKELAQNVLQSIGDGVITTDAAGLIEYLNPIAEQMTGWLIDEAKGIHLSEVFKTRDEATQQLIETPVEQVFRSGQPVRGTSPKLLVNRVGTEYAIDDSAAPICDRTSSIIGAVLVFRDVTQPRNLSRQLVWQAGHDSLTGLVNRREFEHRLDRAIADAHANHHQHVLCYLDLDQFKVVNDTCGHIAGDELLRQLTGLLKTLVRTADTLARLGGDEFGIILNQCPLDQAAQICEQIRDSIQKFRFVWQEKTFTVGGSIGLAAIDRHSGEANSILSAADAACYAAKDNGRNRIHVYQVDDAKLVEQRGERQWVARIHKALEENRLCLYQQAIVPIHPTPISRAEHLEILVRMISETGEIIPPMAFIPAAERYGLMPIIDRWIIQTFLANQHRYYQAHPIVEVGQSGNYTINLSGASINDEQFLPFLKEQLNRYQIPPQTICFEITETVAISNLAKASQFIVELKQLGCSFALDDFGSGMSSFSYLKHLPIDYLKIDGSFIKNIVDNPIDLAMVECIHRMGQVMGIRTIAEFVENPAILERLRAIGIDYAQGYSIAKPCLFQIW